MAVRVFDADSSTTLLDELIAKIREGLSRAGQKQISEYHGRMKTLEAQRHLKTFNFLSFFALKEGLGLVYEAMRSPSAALGIYDELELLFGQRDLEAWAPNFSSFGGDDIGDDSGSLLDFTKKPYRQLLQSGKLTEFDFRQYLFSRQAHLLFILANPGQVLIRGIKFIASFEEAMVKAKRTRLFIDVWAFSAFMDLAEACKATNQSLNNDKSINNILGDAYHSAMCRLDSLGAEFDFLPSETTPFVVGATDSIEPIIDEAEDVRDEHDVHVEPSAFVSPLKSSSHKRNLSISIGTLSHSATLEHDSSTTTVSSHASTSEAHEDEEGPADSMSLANSTEKADAKASKGENASKTSEEPKPTEGSTNEPHKEPEEPAKVSAPTEPSDQATTVPPLPIASNETLNQETTTEKADEADLSASEALKSSTETDPSEATTPSSDLETPKDSSAAPSTPVPSVYDLPSEVLHYARDSSTDPESTTYSNQSSSELPDDQTSQSSNDSEVHHADRSDSVPSEVLPRVSFEGDAQPATSEGSSLLPPSAVDLDASSTPSITQDDDSASTATTPAVTPLPDDISDAGDDTFLMPSSAAHLTTSSARPSAPASPSKSRASHAKSKSKPGKSRTHSRNSSIGEDIFLGDQIIEPDSNPGFSLDEEAERLAYLDAIIEDGEADAPRITTFPELQMSLLNTLNDESAREALISTIHLSQADTMMAKDPSNGAVFTLQYLQACDFISDSGAQKLLQALSRSDASVLGPLKAAALAFERSRARADSQAQKFSSSSLQGATVDEPVLHPSASESMVSQVQQQHISDSTAPLFSFTRVVSTPDPVDQQSSTFASNTPTKLPLPSASSAARQLRHTVSTPAMTASMTEELKPRRHMHFHTKTMLPSHRDADGSDVVNLQIDGITITHPSLSAALVSAHDFDKLYKTVALKSNEAFVSVQRARSSTRIKSALGNLAFARGQYAETLKFFDEALISVYITEGWDRMVFTLYNKIAECYLRLGQMPEYCSALTCLLVPRLRPFVSQQQLLTYQQELIRTSKSLQQPLPVLIDPSKPVDKLIQMRVAVQSPHDKTPQAALKIINRLIFSMGETITLRATVTSEFPAEVVADKFYATFEATNPKTYKIRTFHVGSSKLTLQPGTQTVPLRAQFSKGLWVLASYSMTVGNLTITTRYKHPGPAESRTVLALTVISSAINAKVKVVPPVTMAFKAPQFLHVSIDSQDDPMKEALMMLAYDSNALLIPDGRLPAKLTRTITKKSAAPATAAGSTSPRKKSKNDAHNAHKNEGESHHAESEADSAPAEVIVLDCEVMIGSRAVSLPELPKRSVLEFYLPITASGAPTPQNPQGLKECNIQMDLTYRKVSNEKKSVTTVTPLKFALPLAFEHSIIHNDSVALGAAGEHYFVTSTITNTSPFPLRVATHSTVTEGPILLTQDYAAALHSDQVELSPGDFTTLLFGVSDPSRPSSSNRRRPSSGILMDSSENKEAAAPTSWIGLSIQTEILSNLRERSEPIPVSYEYQIPFVAPSSRYKVGINFQKEVTVGEASKMALDIYLPSDQSTRSLSFAAFYRVLFDPAQWVVTGRTYGKIKGGYTEASLSLVALTATASPPTIQIEEFSNIKDSKSKSVVPATQIALKYHHTSFTILPPTSITGVCREILEH